MPHFFENLNRRYGRYAPERIMGYIIGGRVLVWLFVLLINSNALFWLPLSRPGLLSGQIWRLITFVFVPDLSSFNISGYGLLSFIISLYFLYFISNALEANWGSFYFDAYFLVGMLGAIVSCLLTGVYSSFALTESLFFAFACMYPDVEVLLFFVLPIKVKWIGAASAFLYAYNFFSSSLPVKVAMLLGIANFLLFFGPDVINRLRSRRRKQQWQQEWKNNNYRF